MARQGHTQAQFKLGLLYHHGVGVQKNLAKAACWYRAAAEAGLARRVHAASPRQRRHSARAAASAVSTLRLSIRASVGRGTYPGGNSSS